LEVFLADHCEEILPYLDKKKHQGPAKDFLEVTSYDGATAGRS
jgi:hypothetical protein